MLANLLYDTAFSLRSPGSSTKLLEQKVPATYLALEDVISNLALELRGQGHDPVVRQDQYETMVSLFKIYLSDYCKQNSIFNSFCTKTKKSKILFCAIAFSKILVAKSVFEIMLFFCSKIVK